MPQPLSFDFRIIVPEAPRNRQYKLLLYLERSFLRIPAFIPRNVNHSKNSSGAGFGARWGATVGISGVCGIHARGLWKHLSKRMWLLLGLLALLPGMAGPEQASAGVGEVEGSDEVSGLVQRAPRNDRIGVIQLD
jgi:hypothetical protein